MFIDADITPLLILGLKGLFFVMLLFFTLHAIFLAYHWFSYGNNRSVSILALGIYLAGGAVLLITFALGMSIL